VYTQSKYALFHGVVASTPPLTASSNFVQWAQQTDYVLKRTGCGPKVKETLKEFHRMIGSSNAQDINLFQNTFRPCTPLNGNLTKLASAEASIYNPFQGIHYSNGDFQYNNNWPWTLETICEKLGTGTLPQRITSLAQLQDWWYDMGSGPPTCYDYNEGFWMGKNNLLNITWGNHPFGDDSSYGNKWRVDGYQNCNEWGVALVQPTAASNSIFEELSYLTEDSSHTYCNAIYGIANYKEKIRAFNEKYGGSSKKVDNVMYIVGTTNPYFHLSMQSPAFLGVNSTLFFMQGVSFEIDTLSKKSVNKASLNQFMQAYDGITEFIDARLSN